MGRTRIATAALVTRGEGQSKEILVVRRNPELRFFGGYWAFPGGVVDEADHDGDSDDDLAHRRCGLRELLEEVGFDPLGAASHDPSLRERLLGRSTEAQAARDFRGLLDAHGDSPLRDVRPIARLTTPPFAPVLYRTTFLHVDAPAAFVPDVVQGELTTGAFRRPAELLDEWRRGELLVAPPVVFMLEHFDALGPEAFFERIGGIAAELEAGKLHPIRNVPGIVMAPLSTKTLPPATTTNAYLVGEERIFVVDPAPDDPAELARLEALIEERLCAGASVSGVLLTHHHSDHVGGVERIACRFDAPVLAHAETLRILRERPQGLDVENSRALQDGLELPLGSAPDGSVDWKLTALHTPGHAPGHLAFRESRYGAILAGDLVSTVSTIVIDPPEGHLGTYLQSLERVRELMSEGEVLHPAHGPVAAEGRRVLERYIEHRVRREDALVRALEERPKVEEELVRLVYADVDEALFPIAARSLRAGLEKLREEGRAEETAPASWSAREPR